MAERIPSKRWALHRRAFTLLLRTVQFTSTFPGHQQPFETSRASCAQKALTTPRQRGAIPNWRSAPTLPPATLRVAMRAGHHSAWPDSSTRTKRLTRHRLPRHSLPDVPASTFRVTQSRGQRLLNHVVYRLGDDLVPDHRRVCGIPEKVLIWVRHHGATMR
jgi:hypothetical protein